MKGKIVLSVWMLTVLMGLPMNSFAFDMKVNIDGTELTNVQTATVGANTVYYINISGTTYQNGCATYKIEPNSTTPSLPHEKLARVEAIDSTTDTLWLRNAKITATSDCVDDVHIYFWAVFTGGPDTGTPPNPKVTIQRTANGQFTPAQTGNWITVTGFVQYPVNPDPPDGMSGSWDEIGQADSHVVTCGTCGVFSKSKTRTWDPALGQNLTGDRVMKGDFHFKLEFNGNKLVFDYPTTKGIKIYSKTAANEPEGPQ